MVDPDIIKHINYNRLNITILNKTQKKIIKIILYIYITTDIKIIYF